LSRADGFPFPQSNIPASDQLIFFNGRQLTGLKDSLEVRPTPLGSPPTTSPSALEEGAR